MLDDHDIDKLCHGRIIKACFYNTAKRMDAAGPHFAVILDSDEDVRKHDSYYVVVISHSEESEFRLPVPAYTGLDGFIQGDWQEVAHLAGITEIGQKIFAPDMAKILQLVRSASKAKADKKNKTQS